VKSPDERDSMAVVWAALGLCAGMCLCALNGCGAAPTPVQEADVAAWTADDGMCIKSSSTRAQADDCRDSIRIAFCGSQGLLKDAGACINVHLSDGGSVP